MDDTTTKGNDTKKVLERLCNAKSMTAFMEENREVFKDMSIGEYIELEIEKRNIKKAYVIKNSGINKRYFNDIIAGNKTPNRRYIVRIFLAMELDLSDVQWYLKACDYPNLYAKNKRDAVIIYCLNNKLSVDECNKMLNKIGLENLGFENI